MSRETEIAELLRKAAHATTLEEQRTFVRQAEDLKTEGIEAKRANQWNEEDAVIRDTLVPGRVHELHTAATDWLMDIDNSFDPKEASQAMIAEASLWFGRVSDEVKSYENEYNEQARNLARRLSSRYGDAAEVAERAFLDETTRLRTTAVRSGLVTEAEDAMTATAASTLPEVGQEGYPSNTQFPAQNGTLPPEATSSTRAPALQELANPNPSQDVVPVNDPGLSQQAPFPVSGTQQKESSMSESCPTCRGTGRLARRQASLPSIGDIAKFAASGLDQIDQIADAKDNPSAPGIPYPVDVAFPWVMNPAQQVPAAIGQAEQQIKDRNAKSPIATSAGRTAGRDNSGWIGDMGARGLDYPGEQAPTGDSSSADGYQDPVYGQGGDQGNQQLLPYGHQEADDTTNNPNQWQVGQPTQMDQGWREAVASNPALQSAIAYVNQHRAAYQRTGR
jgi:hypothetical protein